MGKKRLVPITIQSYSTNFSRIEFSGILYRNFMDWHLQFDRSDFIDKCMTGKVGRHKKHRK